VQKADRLIFPAPFIDVLASLFLDESAEIFYSEDEALMDAILVMALMGFSTGTRAGMSSGSSRIVMSSGEYMKDALIPNRTTTKKIGSFGPLRAWCLPMKLT
jgi:hypothetical protein